MEGGTAGLGGDAPVCRLCGGSVVRNRESFEISERMHYVCFHLLFEHDGDVDDPCGVPGCPIVPRDVALLREALQVCRLAMQLGHARYETTANHYIHPSDRAMGEAMGRFGGSL